MATEQADPGAGAGSFSLDELRARLDAPLFHRDQGLAVPTPLPRLNELSVEHAVEPESSPVAVAAPERATTPLRARPTLASFSELLAATSPAVAEAQPIVETPELSEPETEALLAVLAGFGATSATPPHVEAEAEIEAEPEAVATPTPPNGQSRVQAELDRLAFLPDKEESVGPVDIPVIAHTEQHEPMAVPVLSQHEMYNPRPIVMPVGRRNVFEAALEPMTARRRTKKGGVKRLLSLAIVVALLAGGLYAAKIYLLDPRWDPAIKELADEVELARGLDFDHAVEVTTLTGDEYATRIARYALSVNDSNQDAVAGELRALGLLSGTLDLRSIGLAALPETPAFYDARAEEIVVVDNLPLETYRFAMHRALAAALLDQHFGWGSRIDDASPAVFRGTSALYEADALATASGMLNALDRALVIEQRAGLFTSFGVLATPSHFGTAMAGHLSLALRGFIESMPLAERPTVLNGATITDGQALDLRRLVSGEAIDELAGSRGMLFWYHVLASRLDSAAAWNSALAIRRDGVALITDAGTHCVGALLIVDPAALDGVTSAFQSWAQLAPAGSATTVASSLADGYGQLAVHACDPGLAVATNSGAVPLSLGGAPLRSEQYRLLRAAQPTLSPAQAACAVYGSDNVSVADERLIVDPVEGWLAPAAHPAPDPSRCPAV